MKDKQAIPPQRKAFSGEPWVTVVEDQGQLVAIVRDKAHGVVRVPLGRAQPVPLPRSCR